jgi:signal transduction histidine kinase
LPDLRLADHSSSISARLLRAAHELSCARDLASVTSATLRAARDVTCADGAAFVSLKDDCCYYADEHAIAPLWKGRTVPLSTCVAGWVMRHGTPAIIPDVYADSRVAAAMYGSTFVKSLAMVPVAANAPAAAIGVYWSREHHAADGEIAALTTLADLAAAALANVRHSADLTAAVERERDARIAAENASAAKDEFLALVAHELRQPLHASLAALRMMTLRSSREAGERARSLVERQVSQMTALVEDLLDAERIARGHVQLNVAPIDLRLTLERAADSLRPLMSELAHDFIVSLEEPPVIVEADAVRLEQVFANILTNAAKYTEAGGRITLTMNADGDQVNVTIADTGRGIEPSALPTIFDLFARAASDVRGFGVGLAVTRRLVELHGGSIEARSGGRGQGTEFTVSLPIGEIRSGSQESRSSLQESRSSKRSGDNQRSA